MIRLCTAPGDAEGDAVTEEEWFGCADARLMVGALEKRGAVARWSRSDDYPLLPPLWRPASTRLFRLTLSAACRLAWSALPAQVRAAVEVLEEQDDRASPYDQVAAVKRGLWSLIYRSNTNPEDASSLDTARTLRDALDGRRHPNWVPWSMLRAPELPAIIRDVFGNPFPSVSLDAPWRTSTAVGLAASIYADRAFDRLPILADALEDAGCDNADILAHCRGPGPHVRGCWVVDLVLGKE